MENVQNRQVPRDRRVNSWLSVSGVGMGVGWRGWLLTWAGLPVPLSEE